MQERRSTLRARGRWTKGLLAALVFLAVWLLWSPGPMAGPTAEAQIPDPAAQRLTQIQQLQKIHAELVEIHKLLASGKVQVRVVQDEGRP